MPNNKKQGNKEIMRKKQDMCAQMSKKRGNREEKRDKYEQTRGKARKQVSSSSSASNRSEQGLTAMHLNSPGKRSILFPSLLPALPSAHHTLPAPAHALPRHAQREQYISSPPSMRSPLLLSHSLAVLPETYTSSPPPASLRYPMLKAFYSCSPPPS